MSIKTHKAISNAGEADYGKLSARNSTPAAKSILYGCEETSGTTLADYGTGALTLTPGVLTFAGAANAVTVQQAAVDAGDLSLLAPVIGESWISFVCGQITIDGSEVEFNLGSGTTRIEIKGGGNTSAISSPSGVSKAGLVIPGIPAAGSSQVGDDYFAALVYDSTIGDTVSGALTLYGATNTANFSTTLDKMTSYDGVALLATSTISLSSLAAADVYAAGFRTFSGGLPATFADDLASFYSYLKNGVKGWPADWLYLT